MLFGHKALIVTFITQTSDSKTRWTIRITQKAFQEYRHTSNTIQSLSFIRSKTREFMYYLKFSRQFCYTMKLKILNSISIWKTCRMAASSSPTSLTPQDRTYDLLTQMWDLLKVQSFFPVIVTANHILRIGALVYSQYIKGNTISGIWLIAHLPKITFDSTERYWLYTN